MRVSNKRRAVVVDYLEEDGTNPLEGDSVHVSAENVVTGDVGERDEQNNDGEVVLFYPADVEEITDTVTVTGSDGGEVTDTITV